MKIMKKLNNRGFLLVETVIVSVFVLTIFVLVYQNSIPMINEYNQRIRYDDVDSVYAADIFRRLILEDANYSDFITEVDSVGYKRMSDCSVFSSEVQPTCEKAKQYLGVKSDNEIYLTTWDVAKLSTLNTLPRGYLEYVQYLHNQNQDKVTDYRLILSRTTTYTTSHYDTESQETVEEEKSENRYANIGV